MTYVGQQPSTTFDSGIQDRFTGLSSNTVTLTHDISAETDILVVWNNIVQDSGTYSVGGTGNRTLTLGGTLVSGDVVTVYYTNKVMQSVNPTAGSVNKSTLTDEIDIFAGTSLSAADLGTGIHVKTSDSGASANSLADELVVESSATNVGASFLCATNGAVRINFGDSGGNDQGQIKYGHDTDSLFIKTAGTNALIIDGTGAVTKPLQPAFFATQSGSLGVSATGNVNVNFDSERFDLNADYNTSTYTFTAPVTGKYHFDVNIGIINHTTGEFKIMIQPSNIELTCTRWSAVNSTYKSYNGSVLIDMDASDTCLIQIHSQTGGDASYSVGTNPKCYFSGYLVA